MKAEDFHVPDGRLPFVRFIDSLSPEKVLYGIEILENWFLYCIAAIADGHEMMEIRDRQPDFEWMIDKLITMAELKKEIDNGR